MPTERSRKAVLAAWLVCAVLGASSVSCARDVVTYQEALTACHADPTTKCCVDSDCAGGSICDFSLVCAQGSDHQVGCNPGTGDRQCHASCGPANPCPTGQTCQQKDHNPGTDTGGSAMMCVAS